MCVCVCACVCVCVCECVCVFCVCVSGSEIIQASTKYILGVLGRCSTAKTVDNDTHTFLLCRHLLQPYFVSNTDTHGRMGAHTLPCIQWLLQTQRR